MAERGSTDRRPQAFFALVFALSVPFVVLNSYVERHLHRRLPVGLPASALQFVNPLLAALLLEHRENGAAGARRLLRKGVDLGRIRPIGWCAPILG